jgi:UDP-N-acetylglucosamine 2-epimerase (non-hydrolysing)
LTLHRPSNVDVPEVFSGILNALVAIQRELPILFPAHPRTIKRIEEFGFTKRLNTASNLHLVEPLGYLEFLDLMMHSKVILTDSGGIQEETTILGVPCLTLRENTERPITITEGTNTLVGIDPECIVYEVQRILSGESKAGRTPELWDGQTAGRIVTILKESLA